VQLTADEQQLMNDQCSASLLPCPSVTRHEFPSQKVHHVNDPLLYFNKYQLSLTNPRDMLHHCKHAANAHELATELSWQCLRRSTFSSYSELFVNKSL